MNDGNVEQCPIGFECILECISDDFGECINSDYCFLLAKPQPLPYEYNEGNLIVTNLYHYPSNTRNDLKECGWETAFPLPYIHYYDEKINKNYILVKTTHPVTRDAGFFAPEKLNYTVYKDSWGVNCLEVTRYINYSWEGANYTWEPAYKMGLTFETSYIKDGKYRTFPCHTVVRSNLSYFKKAEPLPYKITKKRYLKNFGYHKPILEVVQNLPEAGFFKPVSIEPVKCNGLIVYTYKNYHCMPEIFKSKTQLKKMKLKLAEGQQPKAYYKNYYDIFPYYDVTECESK